MSLQRFHGDIGAQVGSKGFLTFEGDASYKTPNSPKGIYKAPTPKEILGM
jgi:hypothetical protein